MNAAFAFVKFPGAAGLLASAGSFGLSVCEAVKPYLQILSLLMGLACGVITIVEYIARKRSYRAVRHFVETNEDNIEV